jgi:hypothetical protein
LLRIYELVFVSILQSAQNQIVEDGFDLLRSIASALIKVGTINEYLELENEADAQFFFPFEVESETASSKSSVGLISKARANSMNTFIEMLQDFLSIRLMYVL